MKNYKVFFITFAILIILAAITYLVSFGYDEGTMTNKFAGELTSWILKILSFPFLMLFKAIDFAYGMLFFVGLILDIILYSIAVQFIVMRFRRKK